MCGVKRNELAERNTEKNGVVLKFGDEQFQPPHSGYKPINLDDACQVFVNLTFEHEIYLNNETIRFSNSNEIVETIMYSGFKMSHKKLFPMLNTIDESTHIPGMLVKRYSKGTQLKKMKRTYRICIPIGRNNNDGRGLEAHYDFMGTKMGTNG